MKGKIEWAIGSQIKTRRMARLEVLDGELVLRIDGFRCVSITDNGDLLLSIDALKALGIEVIG